MGTNGVIRPGMGHSQGNHKQVKQDETKGCLGIRIHMLFQHCIVHTVCKSMDVDTPHLVYWCNQIQIVS